jgi:hypothetical protein
MKVKFHEVSKISLFGVATCLVACLGACQGSNLGRSLENAIAPVSPPSPDAIAPKSNQTKPSNAVSTSIPITAKPQISPATSSSLSPSKDENRLTSQTLINESKAIALQSLTISKRPKNTLQSLFYINFVNSQPQISEFSDLETVPTPLRPWIKDLNKLGTITPKTGLQFQPNILVARREYARWLLQTNNRLYKNQPSRQIRLAQTNDTASFPDIPNNHPDFAIIQGLANAGLIGGTGDRFRPNDPLLREDLVQWKIPIDLRQPLPNATLETVTQVYGFKDSDRISENALSAVFADAQLRDISNIRRSFGFTTLLQPQKPVTRAEAAASLWYFGTATDGISAAKVLELDK